MENKTTKDTFITDRLSDLRKKTEELLLVTSKQKSEADLINLKFQDALDIVEILCRDDIAYNNVLQMAIIMAKEFERKYSLTPNP